MWGFIAGVLTTAGFVGWAGRRKLPKIKGLRQIPGYPTKLLIWETKKNDLHSRLANVAGGRHGVSHVTVDLGEVDGKGRRLMVDCLPSRGVVRIPRNKYGRRRHATIVLSGEDGRETAGAIKAKIGLPYDSLAMLSGLGTSDMITCSTLVYSSLPERLKAKVKSTRAKGQIGVACTPSQLLFAFGAELDGAPVVI
jgi:hypothetical protein